MNETGYNEPELIAACLRGRPQAFERLVDRYKSLVCSLTYSATGRLDTSEDLAQETFVQAWKCLSQLQDASKFKAWLCSIARSVIQNHLRKQRRTPLVYTDALEDRPAACPQPGPDEALIGREEQAMISQALLRLPEMYRDPLVLFYREDHSIRQVADLLDEKEATIRVRLHRGRQMLKAEVEAMIERGLKQSKPGDTFTKTVMLAVGGIAVGSAATAQSAASAAGSTSSPWTAILSTTTVKLITAATTAAIVITTTLIYTHQPQPEQPATSYTELAAAPAERKQSTPEMPHSDQHQVLAAANTAEPVEAPASEQAPAPAPVIVDSTPASTAAPTTLPAKPDQPQTGMRGVIVVRGNDQPIADAALYTDRQGKKRIAESDANGHFEALDMEPRTRGRIYITAAGYTSRQITVDIVQDRVVEDFKIELTPSYSVTGIVCDPNRTPIEGASVATFQFTNIPCVTDRKGRFTIDGLDPSWRGYSLQATHPDYPAASVGLEAANAGQTLTRDIIMEPGITVSGQVTDPAGRPIEGVEVGNTTSRLMWNCVKMKTDDAGRFELRNIPVGELVLWATHKQYAPFVERYLIDRQSDRWQIDFHLAEPILLSGRLVDRADNPVEGINVNIREYKGVTNLTSYDSRVVSDATGRFTLRNAPPVGTVTLSVYGSSISNMEVDAEAGSGEELLIQIDRAGRIYGRVVDDRNGNPIDHFKVKLDFTKAGTIRGSGFAASWMREGHTFSSAEGFFDTGRETIPIGAEYALTVFADGFDPLTIDPIAVQLITDSPERTEFRLKPETVLAGRVVDCNDLHVAGARIRLLVGTVDTEHFDDTDVTVTRADGTFKLEGLGQPNPPVYITAPGSAPLLALLSDLPRSANGEIEVKMGPPAILYGKVFDPDGNPMAGARVTVHCFADKLRHLFDSPYPNLRGGVTTNAEGYYELTDLPAGEFDVSVSSSLSDGNWPIGHKRVKTTAPHSVELNFGDEAGFIVTGIVRKGPSILENVSISASPESEDNSETLYGYSNSQGQFKIRGFKEGTYRLFIEYRLPRTGQSDNINESLYENRLVSIKGDRELDIDLGDGSVSGAIPRQFAGRENLNLGLRRASESEYNIEWEYAGRTVVAADGSFICPNLRGGRYFAWLVSGNETLTISEPFELQESEHLKNLTLKAGSSTLQIQVIDAQSGRPIPHSQFIVQNELQVRFISKQFTLNEKQYYMTADANGQAAYPNLPAGQYTISCEAPGYLKTQSDPVELKDHQTETVPLPLERAAAVHFQASQTLLNQYKDRQLYLLCTVWDQSTNAPIPPSSLFNYAIDKDRYLVWLNEEERAKPEIKLPSGSYSITYGLYCDAPDILSYRITPPLKEESIQVTLAGSDIVSVDITGK